MRDNNERRLDEPRAQKGTQPVKIGTGRWTIRGINYARGYAKLVNLSTGEKRYVALLNFPGYRSRFSFRLFRKSSSAVERRNRIARRLYGYKGPPLGIEDLVKGEGDGK